MVRETFREDIMLHKDTIDEIKSICKRYNISKKHGFRNEYLLKELKPHIIKLCLAKSVVNPRDYPFTYVYISEKIIGWYVCYFQAHVINPWHIRRLFQGSSRIKITEEQYKDELLSAIDYNKRRYKGIDDEKYIEEIIHLIALLVPLTNRYKKTVTTMGEIARAAGLRIRKTRMLHDKFMGE